MIAENEQPEEWTGRTEASDDLVTGTPIKALAALMDLQGGMSLLEQPLRPCWHWLYFLPLVPQSLIGSDGHPRRGDFLPPVPLARRMWGGSQQDIFAPIRVGEQITRRSLIQKVTHKEGRSGPLVFVQVQHEISSGARLCIREIHDIVYRDMPKLGEPAPPGLPAPEQLDWRREIHPDPVLLMRYSALTFNSHRIHYDRPYAQETEGYPGLVVQGPLIATLLLDLLHRELPLVKVKAIRLKAIKPLFDTSPFDVCGRREDQRVRLWAVTPAGEMAMEALVDII